MLERFASLTNRRSIIDRRAVSDELAALEAPDTIKLRMLATRVLKSAMDEGRAEIAARLKKYPSRGRDCASSQAFLVDQILRLTYDFIIERVHPLHNPTAAERLTLVAVGGYGRGEMAPFSDVDIAFITPSKQTAWSEQVIESMLYVLWDLGLKIGHSSRSLDEMIRMARADLTICTALLESRYIWGDTGVYDEARSRFEREIIAGSASSFVAEKLAERQGRHDRMGDSRYVVEPNIKEGKGGLRDLHTLFWIGKFAFRVNTVAELVGAGLLTEKELAQFQKAENFLWAVRCHLHLIAKRPEERLTFDMQRDVALSLGYAARPGRSSVERFMQHYFRTVKLVGDLSGLFLAHLDEKFATKGRRFNLPSLRRKPKTLDGFILDRGRLAIPHDDFFAQDPVRLLRLFAVADRHELDIHPLTMRVAQRDVRLIDRNVQQDPEANALFLDVLTSPRDPERILRAMNDATVFGRFVPDFGRVVAQMQFDMYHHYTVDEHSIRAIGLLSQIEKGQLSADHPHSTSLMKQILSRRVLYVAVLLHDIAKGRGGDHSVLGAEVAQKLCPRFGMTPAETETVAWLIRYHLLMSDTAFKRDLSDFKTVLDFVAVVQSVERLRLMVALTVVDIRAVGPTVWNSWKRQLLTDLYDASEEVLRLGHKQRGRAERVAAKQVELQHMLGWDDATFNAYAKRMSDAYWVAEPLDILASNARQVRAADEGDVHLSLKAQIYPERGATLVTLYAADHPGLFYRLAGAIHLAGATIIDARIHTSRDGMALDNILVQDPFGQPFDEAERLRRLELAIEDALANRSRLLDRLEAKPLPRIRAEAFVHEPSVLIDNKASNRYTVVEIAARDRPALLNNLAYALFQSKVTIHSAHIATYGERAVDVFYLTDLIGDKIESPARLKTLEKRLLDAAAGIRADQAA